MTGTKANNYDYTAKQRMKRRRERIKKAGLSELRIVGHKDHAAKIRKYAETLYKKEGFSLD